MTTIAIIDYGIGNLRSVEKALQQSAEEPQRAAERIKPEAQDIAQKSIQGIMAKFLKQVRLYKCRLLVLFLCLFRTVFVVLSKCVWVCTGCMIFGGLNFRGKQKGK